MNRLVLHFVAFAAIAGGATRLHAGEVDGQGFSRICCSSTIGRSCCGVTYCSAGLISAVCV